MKKFLLSLLLIVAGAAAAKADVVSILTLKNNSIVEGDPVEARLGKDNGPSSDPAAANYNAAYGGFNGTTPKVPGAKTWNLWHLGWNQDKFLGWPAGDAATVGKLTTNFAFEKPLAKIVTYLTIPNAGLSNGSIKVYASKEKFPAAGADAGELVGELALNNKAQKNVYLEIPLTGTEAEMYYQIVFTGSHTNGQNMLRLFSVDYYAKEDFSFSFLDTELFLNETAKLAKPVGEKVPTLFSFTDENGVVTVATDPEDAASFLITPQKTGKTTVTASWKENDYYLAGSTTFEVNVKPLELGDIEAKINGSLAIQEGLTYDVKSDANPITVYAKNATSIEVKEGDVVVANGVDTAEFTPGSTFSDTKDYTITAKMNDEAVKTLSFRLAIHTDPIPWASGILPVKVTEFDSYVLTFGKPHPEVEFTTDNANISIDKAKIGFDEHSIVITANAPGVTKVTMKWGQDGNFTSGEEIFEVTVVEKERAIYAPSFSALGSVIFTDDKMELSLGDVFPESINFSSSSNGSVTKVEKIGDKAVITKVGEGTDTITCSWDRDADFLAPESPITFELFVPAGKAIVQAEASYKGSLPTEFVKLEAVTDPIDIADFVKISFGAPESAANVFSGSGNIIFEPAKGVALQKIVFPTTGAYNGYISLAEGDGSVKLENGVITWVGPAAEGNGHGHGTVKINATRAVKVPYFEVYYTQKNPDVRLSFDKTSAEYQIGHADKFNAPVLTVDVDASVDKTAATAAIVYQSSNEAIAKVAADGSIEAIAPGTVTISAFIPEEIDQFFSTIAKYTLTVTDPDREIITAAVMGATRTGKFERFTTIHERENNSNISEIVYQAVFAKTDDGGMRFYKGGDGWGSGIYVTDNENGEGIASIKIVFAEGKAGEGVKVYARTYPFDEPQLRTAPVFSAGDAVVADNVKESVEIPLDGYSAFAIVPVASQSEVIVESVTVKYSNKQIIYAQVIEAEEGLKTEVYEEPVAVGGNLLPDKDPMAGIVTSMTVDKALHYYLRVQANTNAPAMKFGFEGHEWIVNATDGYVYFTADYLPAPKESSELSFCAVDAEGNEIDSTKGSTKVQFEHYPASANSVGIQIEENHIEARYDVPEDTYKEGDVYNNPYLHIENWVLGLDDLKTAARLDSKNVIVDLKLDVSGSHTNYPCLVLCSASLRKANPDGTESTLRSLESEYDLKKHQILVKRVHSFPYDAAVNDSKYVGKQIADWTPDKVNVAAHVYFPVVYGTQAPVVTDHNEPVNPVARKFFKAADPETTTVAAVKATRQNNSGATQVLAVNAGDVKKTTIDEATGDEIVTGLEDVVVDAAAADDAEYYNLQGVRILNPAKGQVVIRRQANGQVAKIRF